MQEKSKSRRWWLRPRPIGLIILGVFICLLVIFTELRGRANEKLAIEIRAEYDEWAKSLPKLSDSENGMLIILKGVRQFPDTCTPQRLYWSDFSLNSKSDLEIFKKYLADHEEALDLILQGLKYEKFLSPTDYGKGSQREILPLLKFKRAAELFAWKGRLAELEGRRTDALKEYLNALRLGSTLAADRELLSRMIEHAILWKGIGPLTEILSKGLIGEEELATVLQELIQLHGRKGGFYSAVETGYYSYLLFVADLIDRKIAVDGPSGAFGRFEPWLRFRLSRYVYDYRSDVETYREYLQMCRNVDPTKHTDGVQLDKNALSLMEENGAIIAGKVISYEVVDVLTEDETLWRGAIVLTAIRLFETRNSRLPKNLEELGSLVPKDLLTDPFSGKNLVYRVEGADFCLYSVGYSGYDYGGKSNFPVFKRGQLMKHMLDIIFHAPQQNK